MERQKVVHFAQPRRPDHVVPPSPTQRRPRATTSVDRARIAPLASIEHDSFCGSRVPKGNNSPLNDCRPSSRWGQSRKFSMGERDPVNNEFTNNRQSWQPGSSFTLDSPRGRGSSVGRSAQSKFNNSVDFHDAISDQLPRDQIRHYSFSSVPETWKQTESKGSLKWIRSLRRVQPGPRLTMPDNNQSLASRTSAASEHMLSPESPSILHRKENSPLHSSLKEIHVLRNTSSHDFSTGIPLNSKNEIHRDVLSENSHEMNTTVSRNTMSYTKQMVITSEIKSVSKTFIHEASYSSHKNVSNSSLSTTYTQNYANSSPDCVGNIHSSLCSSLNQNSSVPSPKMRDPLLSPEDLLQCEGFTRYPEKPSRSPKLHLEVGKRERHFIPASKPLPRKLSTPHMISTQNENQSTIGEGNTQNTVCSNRHIQSRAFAFAQLSETSPSSPKSPENIAGENGANTSDTSFETCSSSSFKSASFSDAGSHGSPASFNNESLLKKEHREPEISKDSHLHVPSDQQPQWKRNSLRMATLGYTSMSDLTKSIDCLDLVTEYEDVTDVSKPSSEMLPDMSCTSTNSIGGYNHVYDIPGHSNEHSRPPKCDQILSQKDNDFNPNTINVSGEKLYSPNSIRKRDSFKLATTSISDLTLNPCDLGSHDAHTNDPSLSNGGFRLEKETNSIIYTPTLSSSNSFRKSDRSPISNVTDQRGGLHISTRSHNGHPGNDRMSTLSIVSGPAVVPKHSSPQNLAKCEVEDNDKIKRRSLRLATASISDLTCNMHEVDSSDFSPILRHSLENEIEVRRQRFPEGKVCSNYQYNDLTPDSQRRSSRGSSLSSGRNSSFGSFYSCQSLSANSSPLIERYRHPASLDKDSGPRSSSSPLARRNGDIRRDYKNESSSATDMDESFRTAYETASNFSSNSLERNSSRSIKIGRPWPHSRPKCEGNEVTKEPSVSPRQNNSSYNTVPASGKRKSPKRSGVESSLLCHSTKSSNKERAWNKIPYENDARTTVHRGFSNLNINKEKNVSPLTHSKDQAERKIQTTSLVSSAKQEEYKTPVSVEKSRHDSVYDNYVSELSEDQGLEDSEDNECWAGMPRSPPSLGRPRRKLYAGFDSQPLPMDAFLSDSSSVYTTNTSCSSRAPSRSAEASHRGSDWSIAASETLRPSSSLTYQSTRTTPTEEMFDSKISVNSFQSSSDVKTHSKGDFTSDETLVDSTNHERGSMIDSNTQYDNADPYISMGGSKSYPNLKQNRNRNMVLPLKFDQDADKTPTATPVDDKQSRELGQLYNLPRSDGSPTKESGRGSKATTPVNAVDKKGPRLSGASSAMVGPCSFSQLSSKPKYFSSRDIFDLFLTSDGNKHGPSGALSPLEKQAHKVCRAILCCNSKKASAVVAKEYLL